MGRAIVRAASERSDVRIAAGLESAGSTLLDRDLGETAGCGALGIRIGADAAAALTDCDAVADFSHASAVPANLAACVAAGKPLLIGTTGLTPQLQRELERAAQRIPLLVAANTSIGVTALLELVRQCARLLPPQFDIEILEAHHRHKRDAPSGTALALGEAAAEGRSLDLGVAAVRNRADHGPREGGEIGFAVVRGGDVAGEHSVLFLGPGEQLILTHRAADRAIFARGALDALVWLARRPPGRYSMRDTLDKSSS